MLWRLKRSTSRAKFQRILEEVGNDNQRFCKEKAHIIKGVSACSLEEKMFLPLKALAITAAKEFDAVNGAAVKLCRIFAVGNSRKFEGRFRSTQRNTGVFVSFDCSYTYWTNCPKGVARQSEAKAALLLEECTTWSDLSLIFYIIYQKRSCLAFAREAIIETFIKNYYWSNYRRYFSIVFDHYVGVTSHCWDSNVFCRLFALL